MRNLSNYSVLIWILRILTSFITLTLIQKNKPFGYLLVDLHQQQSNEVRIRTNLIFDGKPEQTVYVKIQEYPELCKRIGCSHKKQY